MRHLLIVLFVAVLGPASGRDSKAGALFDAGNTAYVNADYHTAMEYYDSIIDMGLQSAKLYYNMGNACFKAGKIGPAILYYNKAQRLAPMNADIEHNLAVAGSFTRDNIVGVPRFFASRWVVALRSMLGSNAWALVSLALLALFFAGALLYLLPVSLRLRKTGLGVGISSAVLYIVAATFASVGRSEALHPREGVIMISACAVKSAPDASGKDLFVLHEGTKVKITDALNDWREITVQDGNSGWINVSSIALID